MSPYRRLATSLPLLLCLGLPSAAAHAQAPSPQLSGVLAQMDAASRNFTSATASFHWEFVEKVAGMTDTTRQTGSMFIGRGKDGISFGAAVYDVGDNGQASATPSKIIDFNGATAQIYSPAEKQEDVFKAGGNQNSIESYLSLGFGGSGHDLANAWQVTDGGPVTIDGTRTEKLVLVSKDAAVRNTFRQVTIWVDPVRDVSLRQVFDLPDGDQRTANYTDLQLNRRVNKKPYEIPARGVTVVPH